MSEPKSTNIPQRDAIIRDRSQFYQIREHDIDLKSVLRVPEVALVEDEQGHFRLTQQSVSMANQDVKDCPNWQIFPKGSLAEVDRHYAQAGKVVKRDDANTDRALTLPRYPTSKKPLASGPRNPAMIEFVGQKNNGIIAFNSKEVQPDQLIAAGCRHRSA